MSTTEQTAEVARRFFQAIYRFDISAAGALLDDDATWWLAGSSSLSGNYIGKRAIFEDFLPRFGPLYAPVESYFEIKNLFADGELACLEYLGGGETVDGNAYRSFYAYVVLVQNGKVTAIRGYTDLTRALAVLLPATVPVSLSL